MRYFIVLQKIAFIVPALLVFVSFFAPVTARAGADLSRIKTVAVISAIGDHVTISSEHFIGSQTKSLDTHDWNLDAEVETRLRQYLSRRFEFTDIPYDRAKLAAIPNGHWDGLISGLPGFLKSLPDDSVDAFLIVRPGLAYQSPGPEGLGLTNADAPNNTVPLIWANFELDIIDAHTKKNLAVSYSRIKLRDNGTRSVPAIPGSVLLKADSNLALNDGQKVLLHGAMSTLVNLSLIESLRFLDIGADVPAPSARTMVPIAPLKDPFVAYRNVAVVSALGDDFLFHHLGGTIFSQNEYVVPEPDWHIDSLVEDRARMALSRHFTVVEPNVDRSQFRNASLLDDAGKPAPSFPGLKQGPDIDLYVVFVKLKQTAAGVIDTRGVGVFNHTPVTGEPDRTFVFAHYAVVAIDARTMKVLEAHSAVASPEHAVSAPHQDVAASDWPETAAELTPQRTTVIRSALSDIVDDTVDETLLQMDLLGVIPSYAMPLSSAAASPR